MTCECSGQCGSERHTVRRCAVRDRSEVLRHRRDPARWLPRSVDAPDWVPGDQWGLQRFREVVLVHKVNGINVPMCRHCRAGTKKAPNRKN